MATCVVDVTVNGAVPVATFETMRLAVTVPLISKLAPVMLPPAPIVPTTFSPPESILALPVPTALAPAAPVKKSIRVAGSAKVVPPPKINELITASGLFVTIAVNGLPEKAPVKYLPTVLVAAVLVVLVIIAVPTTSNFCVGVVVPKPPEPVVNKLPPVTLPVADTTPPVVKLAPDTLPVAVIVPATLAPVPVTTNTLALPPTLVLTLPLATGINTLDVPLAMPAELTVAHVRTPEPLVCRN